MAENFALYRKYRPANFSEVLGQDHVISVLEKSVADRRVSHAYLFSGPRGSGKTSVARILARAVNCQSPASIPCGKCEICRDFISGNTLDLVEIDAASNRGIDEVRALKEYAYLAPAHAARKTYIIDEIHMMTKDAFNALLKILEEPPAHILFIMATTEPEKLLETVVSRTQHFRFKPLTEMTIQKSLLSVAKKEGMELAKEAAGMISFFADGSLRDALNYLAQVAAAGNGKIGENEIHAVLGVPPVKLVEAITEAIFSKNSELAYQSICELEKSGGGGQLMLKVLLRNFRHLLLLSLNPPMRDGLKEQLAEREYNFLLGKLGLMPAAELERTLTILLESASQRFQSPYPTLQLELAIARILQK
ncbi:MAG: DNA polymerase III subunit gamma/tau [Patescibacteria group bacterium]|mgnify:CR=1 FL=1